MIQEKREKTEITQELNKTTETNKPTKQKQNKKQKRHTITTTNGKKRVRERGESVHYVISQSFSALHS